MKELIGDYDAVVANINRGLAEAGIATEELAMLDHLCYRTETIDEYQSVLREFKVLGSHIGEVVVQGRLITTVALDNPIKTGGWLIPFLEVAAPKPSSPYSSGLEHAEFVTVQLLSEFARRHAELNFIRNAMSRVINPELKYRENGISVKFHHTSLGAVVELENSLHAAGWEE